MSVRREAFRGGRGSVTLTRYIDSPIGRDVPLSIVYDTATDNWRQLVGPFDELSISPGEFTNPFTDPSHRVTRSYVSSLAAVVNGR